MSQPPVPQTRPPAEPSPSFGKSVLDRAVAGLLLLLLGLWLAVIALAIWLSDDGPLLVRDLRVGRYGRRIRLLRFRGRPAVRLSSLDVLPRLLNVLRGDLSLVGPPARSPDDPRARLHPAVRPGLVRPWPDETAPRSDAEEVRAVQRYLRTWSPGQDLRLLWAAVAAAARPGPRSSRAAG